MVRLVYLTLAVAVIIGISAVSAQTGGNADARLQSMTGAAKAVSASSLTIERRGREIVFSVDQSTHVFRRNLARTGARDLVLPRRERSRSLADIVDAGDQVTVRYRQSGSSRNAVEVTVVQTQSR